MSSADAAITEGNPFDRADAVTAKVIALAEEFDLPRNNGIEALVALMGELISSPNSVFDHPPEYVRDLGDGVSSGSVLSTHGFFDVVKSRASRRDFGTDPLDEGRLHSVIAWTVGKRDEVIAYDFRGAPLRFVPSAGGLASIDAYVITNTVAGLLPGSYYFDYRSGLVHIMGGHMMQRVADSMPEQDWVAASAALVVFVGNVQRVSHKYGPMGFKLMLLDAGIAAGHADLVANALELRSTILGGLPPAELSKLLGLDGATRVPLVSVAIGTRTSSSG